MCSRPRTPNELVKRCGTAGRAFGKSFFKLYSHLKRATYCHVACSISQLAPDARGPLSPWMLDVNGRSTRINAAVNVRSLIPYSHSRSVRAASFTLVIHTMPSPPIKLAHVTMAEGAIRTCCDSGRAASELSLAGLTEQSYSSPMPSKSSPDYAFMMRHCLL